MEIRLLRREELADAERVVRRAFATVAAEFGLTEETCPTNGAFLPEGKLEAQLDAGVRMAGAFDGNVMIGFAALDLSDAEKPELEKLSVLPQHRHGGAGRRNGRVRRALRRCASASSRKTHGCAHGTNVWGSFTQGRGCTRICPLLLDSWNCRYNDRKRPSQGESAAALFHDSLL